MKSKEINNLLVFMWLVHARAFTALGGVNVKFTNGLKRAGFHISQIEKMCKSRHVAVKEIRANKGSARA